MKEMNLATHLTQPLIPYTILPSFETAHSARFVENIFDVR